MASVDSRLLAGRYRTVRRLGAGGMATVWLAEDENLGRFVAVKRLHAESPEDVARRFQREARIGASLAHPNLVAVYDAVSDEDDVLLIMEYVDGPTLAQEVSRRGPLDAERAAEVVDAVAAALDHAHRGGVVHRDVKPANVLLGDVVKVADLGIASAVEGTQITRTGSVLGTPAYMAPEQLEGGGTGPAADVYALAALAYEALSARKARPGRTPMEIAHRVATEPPPDLRDDVPDAPPVAAEALRRGMARDPAERPASAGALAQVLREGLGLGPGAAGPPSVDEAPTREWERAGGGAGSAAGSRGRRSGAPGAGSRGRRAGSDAPGRGRGGAVAGRRSGAAGVEVADDAAVTHAEAPAGARGRKRWIAAGLLALAALGVVGAIALGGGATEAEPEAPAQAPAPPPAAPPAAPDADPAARAAEDAVREFYELSAANRFEEGWRLAGPSWRAKLQGYEGYRNTFDTLQQFEFIGLEATESTASTATVQTRSVARHTTFTDRCRSTFELSRSGRRWRIDDGSVQCG